jgi:hypothetical protein
VRIYNDGGYGVGEWRAKDRFILALAERVFAQSELLSKRAEKTRMIAGVGKDAPTVTNAAGAKQSGSPYRADLFPPVAYLHVSAILKEGAAKYGDDNWRGIPVRDHVNHALVHLAAHLAGDTQDDHIGHAACRLMMGLEIALVGEKGADGR